MSQNEPPQPPVLDLQKLLKLIQPDGLLSKSLTGFESRDAQQGMLGNIAHAYNEDQIALIEAGTGTGKSIAYLVPALIWAYKTQERTVISTHTIALQEQLVNKDIPKLIKALNLPMKAALLKGMNNYLCLRKVHENQMETPLFATEETQELAQIDEWVRTYKTGSRSEIPFRISANGWEKVGADSDACSYHSCPYFKQCYYFKAREEAEDSKIVVINHSLLFADLLRREANKNYDKTAIIPSYKRLIVDEAHHLEDVATEFFAISVSRNELIKLLNKLLSEKQGAAIGKLSQLKEYIQRFHRNNHSHELRSVILQLEHELPTAKREIQEQAMHLFSLLADFLEIIVPPSQPLREEKAQVEQKLRIILEHFTHPHWKECLKPQTEKLVMLLNNFLEELSLLESKLSFINAEKFHVETDGIRLDISSLLNRLRTQTACLNQFISPFNDPNSVRWIEEHQNHMTHNVHIFDAQLDVSKMLMDLLFNRIPTIVLCSATLTTNRSFDFFKRRMGLNYLPKDRSLTENIYESPFNYPKQALFIIPKDIPDPSHQNFTPIAIQTIFDTIQACQGQAFVLFTSYTMLEECYIALNERLTQAGFPLFKQGSLQRGQLLHQFKQTKRSVLFGTSSFWEGIDVAGDALRCVIIVKLPFKVPSEPLVAARNEFIQIQGGNPFIDYAIPSAIVKFKQGFGRLIRNQWDRGCIVCLDTRIITKPYGKLFLNSLPDCERFFGVVHEVPEKMTSFYKKTYYLVHKSPYNQPGSH